MTSRPEEIRALTGVRAYAAVWVMLLHLPLSLGIVPHVQLGAVAGHGAWGVDVFFVLSGFILSLLYAPRFCTQGLRAVYRNYLAARFARIYPLHLAAIAVLAAYFLSRAAISGGTLARGLSLSDLALNLTLLHGWGFTDHLNWNYPSWSISSEWFAYLLLTPLYALALRRWRPAATVVLALAAWTALYAFVHSVDQTIREQTVIWSVPRITAEFLLGYALYRVYDATRTAPRMGDAMMLGGIGALVALCFLPDRAEWFLAPAVALLVLGLARTGPVGNALFGSRWAVFWGERSYAIYMLHAVVQAFSNLALVHLHARELTSLQAWMLLALLIAAVLAAAHLAYGRIELPMRGWLRRRLERRATAVPAAPVASTRVVTS